VKKIKIIIEKSADSFGAYSENASGIFGAGATANECKQSILDAIDTLKELDNCPDELKGDFKLVFKFDTISLLN